MSREVYKLDEKEIIRLYLEEELSVLDIAKKFKVNFGTIKLRLTKNNIPIRTQSQAKKIVMNRPEVKKRVSEASKRSSKQRMETNMKKFGAAVPSNNPKKRKEWEENYIKEHGFAWNKDPRRMEKSKETCLERYGVDNGSKTEKSKEKISQSRWKNKSKEELDKIQQKTKDIWKITLDTDNPLKNDDIKEGVRRSRWLNKSKEDLDKINDKSQETRISNSKNNVIKKLGQLNVQLCEDFFNVTNRVKFKCLKCNYNFESVIDYIFHDYGLCPRCYPKNSSKWERGVRDYIMNLLGDNDVECNNRHLLPSKKEIDILIPNKKIGIECDGVYMHSDKIISKNPTTYHLEKTEECTKLGINLIHIFEDEWEFKNDIVKGRIKNLFGNGSSQRIHARQCIVKEIIPKIKNEFLEKYHIQGSDLSTIKLGAFYNNELVSVMTFSYGNPAKGLKRKEGIWELNRFCSNFDYHIPGIASKLLSHFKNNYSWDQIFSYADRRWSTGNLYYQLGFNLVHITKPNYWYVKGIKRIHRYNLRKRPDEPKDIPEWILRQNEGYARIWDCGSYKFMLER